jgi:low affinity Fe/Cu permease
MRKIYNKIIQAPFLLSILSLFLIFIFIIEVKNFWLDAIVYDTSYMLRPALALVYLILWILCLDFKKWAMYLFVGITLISFLLKTFLQEVNYTSQLFSVLQEPIPINIILAMLLLLHFKKFK